eukprot:gene10710-7441_t
MITTESCTANTACTNTQCKSNCQHASIVVLTDSSSSQVVHHPSLHRMSRRPIRLDDAEIDFATATAPTSAATPLSVEALLGHGTAPEAPKAAPTAVDPRLQNYVASKARLGGIRRRRGFFTEAATQPQHPVSAETSEAVQAALENVTQRKTPQQRRDAFEAQARELCQAGPCRSSSSSTEKGSTQALPSLSFVDDLLESVPDVEPWDRWALTAPRYDRRALVIPTAAVTYMHASTASTPGSSSVEPNAVVLSANTRAAAAKAGVDLVHIPVIPDSLYTRYYQFERRAGPPPPPPPKTKEEKRQERREKQRQRQLDLKRRREAGEKIKDRLSKRNLLEKRMVEQSVLNPLATDTVVLSQYAERFYEHQRMNFERHMAALPHQIAKRALDAKRHAEENPVLRCYRIFPVYSARHLGMLRNMANDNRLRGFFAWTAEVEAVVVLAGGEVAARHLDRWILHKTAWESDETTAVRVCSIRLQSAAQFSFHARPGPKRPREAEGEGEAEGEAEAEGREAVFLAFFDSVEETCRFFAQGQPATTAGRPGQPHPSPWSSLLGLWRVGPPPSPLVAVQMERESGSCLDHVSVGRYTPNCIESVTKIRLCLICSLLLNSLPIGSWNLCSTPCHHMDQQQKVV